MKLKFYQIYFLSEQLKQLYDFATPYRNECLTDFFENEVIAREVPRCDSDYIGIASWRLREKRQSGFCPIILKFKNGVDDLTEEKILKQDADIINLRPFLPTHQMLANAAAWHGGEKHNFAWDNAIADLRKFIHIPKEVKTPIYENHFIARKEIYHEYISRALHPVMEYMRGRDCYYADSGYAEKKARDKQNGVEAVERYRKQTGRKDWPIAPFILERLFSIFINNKDYKIINV